MTGTSDLVAPRDVHAVEMIHGSRVEDPYRWLEDGDATVTRRWEQFQAERLEVARKTWGGRDEVLARLRALMSYELVSPPLGRHGRLFYTRRAAGADFAVLVVRDHAGERVLLDPAVADPMGRTQLDAWSPSPDGRLLAFQTSPSGTEHSTLWVMDVATGQTVDGPIDRVRHTSVAWLPHSDGFYYVRRRTLASHYDRRVHLHRLGADAAADPCVFGEDRDVTEFYAVYTSPCGRWLSLWSARGKAPANDLWIADLTAGPFDRPAFRVVQERLLARTVLVFGGDRLLLRTDLDAPNGRVVSAPVTDPAPANWTVYIPDREDAVLADFATLPGAGIGLATWIVAGVHRISAHALPTGALVGHIPLPGDGFVRSFRPDEPHATVGYLEYSDYTTPPTVLRVDGARLTVQRWTEPEPRGVVPRVVTRTVSVVSRDGVRVPMSVISPSDSPDRPRPTLLTAYGGFGVSVMPKYHPEILAWVGAGGVYAEARVRGGREHGRRWHIDAIRDRRQNAFDDFDAAARHLMTAGWTARDMLGIHGSSNGGLLVCVALTQHPQRYTAAVAISPLTDMLRYEATGMGPSWREEYGTVSEARGFEVLASYSPYHHVRPGVDYPAVMLAAFDGDTRVDPLHARKMCAALQFASTRGEALYRLDKDTGHDMRPLSSDLELHADVLAFLAAALGLDVTASHVAGAEGIADVSKVLLDLRGDSRGDDFGRGAGGEPSHDSLGDHHGDVFAAATAADRTGCRQWPGTFYSRARPSLRRTGLRP